MKTKPENFLDAPVAGMSLTAEPKSRPWRRPSDATTVDEALAMYAPIFKNKKTAKMLLQQIENGIPLTSIADLLITANTMEGRHSLDVGVLISPVLVETMISFADMAEVDYVIGNEEKELPEERTELVNRAIQSVSEKEDSGEMPMEDAQEPSEIEEAPVRTGLMARKEVV